MLRSACGTIRSVVCASATPKAPSVHSAAAASPAPTFLICPLLLEPPNNKEAADPGGGGFGRIAPAQPFGGAGIGVIGASVCTVVVGSGADTLFWLVHPQAKAGAAANSTAAASIS